MSDEAVDAVAARMRALGEPTRIRIVELLERGSATVQEVTDHLDGTPQQTTHQNVSKHLRWLRQDGIVASRKEGNRVRYAALAAAGRLSAAGVEVRRLRLDGGIGPTAAAAAGIEPPTSIGPAAALDLAAWVSSAAVVRELAALELGGIAIDWAAILPDPGREVIDLPTYAFERRRFWPEVRVSLDALGAPSVPTPPVAAAAAAATALAVDFDGDPLDVVLGLAATVLGQEDVGALDPDRSLLELGFTSFGAVELRNRLIGLVGRLPESTMALQETTPRTLAAELELMRDEDAPLADPARAPAPSPPPPATWPFADLLLRAHKAGRLRESIPILVGAAALMPAAVPAARASKPASILVSEGSAEPTLLCLPSFLVGSGAHQYIRFATELTVRRRVLALELPGFAPGTAVPESWDELIDGLAAAALEAVEEAPFALLGNSVGGVIAADVATALAASGHEPTDVLMCDTFAPAEAPDEVFAWAAGMLLDRVGDQWSAIDDAGVAAMARYMALLADRPPAPAPSRSLALRASAGPTRDWPRWAAGEEVEVDADHFSMLEERVGETVAVIERRLLADRDAATISDTAG